MADKGYTQQYFSSYATEWLAAAYGEGLLSPKFPVGSQRVRVAIEMVAERLAGTTGRMVDLGCGGGDLCLVAAQMGFSATGVDIAEGMIRESRRKVEKLPADKRDRVSFVSGDILEVSLGAQPYDVATALGVIEYLPDDDGLFRRAFELLRPGGVFVLSCRNRLFNLFSLNQYTLHEIKAQQAEALLEEVQALAAVPVPQTAFRDLAVRLQERLPDLEAALALDGSEQVCAGGIPPFDSQRRQHTPRQLEMSARKAGFTAPSFIGVHPHPMVGALEQASPHFYNQLAGALEVFERLPVALLFSSAFVAAFTKP